MASVNVDCQTRSMLTVSYTGDSGWSGPIMKMRAQSCHADAAFAALAE